MFIRNIIDNLIEEPCVCYNGDLAFLLYDKNGNLLRFMIDNKNEIEVLLLKDGFIIEKFTINETNKIARMNQLLGEFLDK